MPTGSCFCGNVRIEYTGEPAMTVLCHCLDCRKISGSSFSYNILVPSENFKATGAPKTVTKIADSGKSITSKFCPDCGTTVYGWGDRFGGEDGLRIIKAGVIDDIDALHSGKPGLELYASERLSWVAAIESATSVDQMPAS